MHGSHRVDTMASVQQNVQLTPFSTSLAPSFSDTRGLLNFLSVQSCSQNLPLISCMFAYKSQWGLTVLGLISITGVKHLAALLAKKNQRRPQWSTTVLCTIERWKLSHHLQDIRLVSIQWPWNRVRVTQGHRKLNHSIRRPWLPINVP